MRIVHLSDFYLPRLGGVEVQVAGLATRQRAAGHDVSVLTATRAGSEPDAVPVLRRPAGGTTRALRDADVVQVHLGGFAPMGWQVLRARGRLGLPTVVTVHSVLDGMQGLHQVLSRTGGWRRAPFVWCGVSRPVADQLQALLGRHATVQVVPNAVEHSLWSPGPARRSPGDPLLVVSALRHARRKRVTALPGVLAAAAQLHAAQAGPADRPFRAVIAGQGARTPELRRELHRRGLDAWVELPGRLSQHDLRALYARADVFLAPTVRESFGLAALEARCAGLPVLARRESGTAGVLAEGREATFAASDAEMSRVLADLLLDHGRREALARHNRATAPQFTWDRTLALTDLAYDTALALAPTPAGRPLPARRQAVHA
jgi:glycosyltransferase involved in cell wall biosynthesis